MLIKKVEVIDKFENRLDESTLW